MFPFKFNPLIFYKRLQAADPHFFVCNGLDLFDGDILARFQCLCRHHVFEEILELHRFHAKAVISFVQVAFITPMRLDHIIYDCIRLAPLYTGTEHIHISRIQIQCNVNDGGCVRFFVLAQRRVICPDDDKIRLFEIHQLRLIIIQPLFIKICILRVNRVILHFRVKRCHAFRYFHFHQVIIGKFFIPQDLCAFQHRLLIRLIKCPRVLPVVIIKQVGINALPFVPQGLVCRP